VDEPSGTATVRMGGSEVEGVPWAASSYFPIEGDRVTLVRDRSAGFLITGTLSTAATASKVRRETVLPLSAWLSYNETMETGGAPGRGRYGFGAQLGPTDRMNVTQGPIPTSGMGDDPNFIPSLQAWCLVYTADLSMIPSDATGTYLSMRFDRVGEFDFQRLNSLVRPRMHGHQYTSTPPQDREPTWDTSDTGWTPAGLPPGESVTVPLPPDWSHAILTGALSGVAMYSPRETDVAYFYVSLLATYYVPESE